MTTPTDNKLAEALRNLVGSLSVLNVTSDNRSYLESEATTEVRVRLKQAREALREHEAAKDAPPKSSNRG
jgi:hypothetical protein